MILLEMGPWRSLGLEGEILLDEISDLVKQTPESSSAPPPLWGYSENTISEPGVGSHQKVNLLEPFFWKR